MLNIIAVLTTAGLSRLEKAAKTCPLPIENLTYLCYNHIQKNNTRAGSLWHNADLATARKRKKRKNNVHSIDQRQSWQADADKWGEWIASIKPLTDIDTEVADLKTYFKSRQEWGKDNLESITKVYCTVKFEADGEVVHSETVRLGEEIGTLPEAPEKEGYTFAGWYDAEDEIIEFLFPMDDMTATAKYEKIQDEDPKPEDSKPADEDSKPDDDSSADDTSEMDKGDTDKTDDTSSPESGADSEPKAAAATSNPKTNAVQGLGVLTIAAAAIIITAKKKHR